MPRNVVLAGLVCVLFSTGPVRAQDCDRTVPGDHPGIQEAIDASADGETVCVEAGTYAENIDFVGRAIHLLGVGGAVDTVIYGAGAGPVVQFVSGEDGDSVLEGFTLTGGYSSSGGGIYLASSSPRLTNLIVTGNTGGYYGGGMYLDHASPTVDHVLVSSNHGGYYGGGMYLDHASPVLTDVVIASNHGGYGGGGMYLDYASPDVTSAVFSANSGGYYGGGLELNYSTATLTNVAFSSNSGGYDGGAVYLGATSTASLAHCNAWNNSPADYFAVDDPGWAPTGVGGNIAVDPDYLDDHFHLGPSSQLIDAGDPGLADPDASTSDIGAYGGPEADAWDLDGDGFPEWWQPGAYDPPVHLPLGLDCDDRDPSVYPFAGCGCLDADGDGYEDAACGGDDCDDGDPGVNPGAEEVADGQDNDCDDMVDEGLLAPGALLVTEIMSNPSMVNDTDGEWFEVFNATPYEVNLDGLIVEDLGADSFTVSGDVWLAAGGHGVLARSADPGANGGVPVDYAYDGLWLAGSVDEIVLSYDGVELDRVEWWDPEWPDAAGASMSLDAGAYDLTLNDDPDSWCEAMDPYGLGDLGSPGDANPVCCPDLDGDGYGELLCGGDCDDGDPDQFPGADEACNGEDDDCDGLLDEDDAIGCVTYYRDDDGDTFGQTDDSVCSCAATVPYDTTADGDCDDGDPLVHPGAPEICDGLDSDCDGSLPADEEDDDGDGYASCEGDCDDGDPGANPGATELCNLVDDDCDGDVDEGFDQDGDGYTTCAGDCNDTLTSVYPGAVEACDLLDNDCDGQTDEGFDLDADSFASCAGDCDDANPAVHPMATEVCDGLDNDCNGLLDEGFDQDGDGHTTCEGDCDDGDADVHPGALEACNGVDDDCDGLTPTDETDDDGDGQRICEGDCDDGDAAVLDGGEEVCDQLDNDCDGLVDEDTGEDLDGDGYNECQGDCDDGDADVFPGAIETCNGMDDDCDGDVPDDELDSDADGYAICEGDCDDFDPAANRADLDGDGWDTCDEPPDCADNNSLIYPDRDEDCDDGLDNDCDGLVDGDDPECAGDDDDTTGDDDSTSDDDTSDPDWDDDDDDSKDPGGCGCEEARHRRTTTSAAPASILLLALLLGCRRRR